MPRPAAAVVQLMSPEEMLAVAQVEEPSLDEDFLERGKTMLLVSS